MSPVCECHRCQAMGRHRPAKVVHHIVSIERAISLRLEMSNLKSMCWECHEVEEGRQKDREYERWKKHQG